MRRLCRFASALLGVLVLQVVLLGSGAVCPEVPAAVSEQAAGGAGGEHAGHQGHGPQAPVERDDMATNPHAPVPPHCVVAMNCSMVAVAGVSAGLPAASAASSMLVVACDDAAPASPRGAPEPPPPRG